ncbi:hypothetical protein T440DRAFT_539686, partial [Plenodomus tracheiphilus IPT5]
MVIYSNSPSPPRMNSKEFVDRRTTALNATINRPRSRVFQCKSQNPCIILYRCQSNGGIPIIQNHSPSTFKINEQRPRRQPLRKRPRMRQVMHKQIRNKTTIFHIRQISLLFQLREIAFNLVFDRVRRPTGVCDEAPFRRCKTVGFYVDIGLGFAGGPEWV